jgi:hypothetical protein
MGYDTGGSATRRTWRIVAGIVGCCALALAAVVVGATLESTTATADPVRVNVAADGSRVVTFVDPRQSPDTITRLLAADGIRCEITPVASGPSRVGTLLSISLDREVPRSDAPANVIRLPAGFDGTLRLTVGVATPPGADYAAPTDPFAVGEPLAGFGDDRSAAAVAAAAEARGLSVVALGGEDGHPVDADALGHATVVAALMLSAERLLLRVE